MIKGIILDVDGVIVGEKIGFNSPWPHPDVIKFLKSLKRKGLSISLLTAKPHYSIDKIIRDAHLDNLHITDGGSVIIDPLNNKVLLKQTLNLDTSINILNALLENNVYTEFYTVDGYFIQRDRVSEITKVHSHILQKEPKITDSLIEESKNKDITKIMPVSVNEEDKNRISKILEPFEDMAKISWGVHPIALPHLFGIITDLSVSKKNGAIKIKEEAKISFNEILGVGDSTSDWQFLEMCGYVGTLKNATKELKELIRQKGKSKYFIGKSVDKNGILDIFKYFKL